MINIIISCGILILAGLIDGILEGYGFDNRKSFERKFGVKPLSYFGGESWKRAYKNNDPEQGFKSDFVKWLGAWDFYHHSDDSRKLLYIVGGMLTMTLNYNFIILLTGAFIVSAITKSLGMKWIRK